MLSARVLVGYINILTWLRGVRVKVANCEVFFCLSIPKRDLNTKETAAKERSSFEEIKTT